MRKRARIFLAGALLAAAAPVLADGSFRLFLEPRAPSRLFETEPHFDLGLSFPAAPETTAAASLQGAPLVTPPLRLPDKGRMTWVTAGVLVGSAVSSLSGGWTRHFESFHFTEEGWFGRGTYAGGADKVSHLVLYNILARELRIGYERMGYETDRAYAMGFGVALAGGLIVELGDGIAIFGFSWEDLLTDAIGAGSAVLISRSGLDDLVGFRFGPVPSKTPPACCRLNKEGKDYSKEIYTADIKLAGAAKRLGWGIGPARFLYLSMTYGSKGYKFSYPEFRQRDIGVELGVNFTEILTAAGVRDTTWWGRPLFIFFNSVRIPFTAIGYRYDLNHHRWHGPDSGENYDPGP
jgi:hypothetical protein